MQYSTLILVWKYPSYCKNEQLAEIKDTDCMLWYIWTMHIQIISMIMIMDYTQHSHHLCVPFLGGGSNRALLRLCTSPLWTKTSTRVAPCLIHICKKILCYQYSQLAMISSNYPFIIPCLVNYDMFMKINVYMKIKLIITILYQNMYFLKSEISLTLLVAYLPEVWPLHELHAGHMEAVEEEEEPAHLDGHTHWQLHWGQGGVQFLGQNNRFLLSGSCFVPHFTLLLWNCRMM